MILICNITKILETAQELKSIFLHKIINNFSRWKRRDFFRFISTKTIIFAGKTNRYESFLGTLRGWQIPNPRPADGISAGTG
jgi:hypothetical protein